MNINAETQIMARLHPEANTRGLTIYNPYFEKTKTNALYLLFHNPKLKPLINGLKNLNLAGAIPAGFEQDSNLLEYMDELGPTAKRVGKVGLIRCRDGKLFGEYQAGYGLAKSINQIVDVNGKSIVVFGAGQVVKALLCQWDFDNVHPKEVIIYNRTVKKAEMLARDFIEVKDVRSMEELTSSGGDLFINATYAGSPWGKQGDSLFTEKLVSNYNAIADVSFVPLEPKLIQIARRLNKPCTPGWQMFLYQGKMCLEKILDIKVNEDVLGKLVVKDFKTNWV